MTKKEFFMQKALRQAAVALKYGEVPIGAVVVDAQGVVLGRAFNKVETVHTQTAHAEVLAIARACKKNGDWRLNGCWLYVTLEPCLMCLGLIQLSRIEGVVFGAKSHLFGSRLHTGPQLPSYAKHLKVEGGIKEAESIALLKAFFKDVRKKRKDSRETACGVCSEDREGVK
jgi:tRNA(adenine34) deaminase